eukprot:CAMPEP_0197181700 /NCGR_PEP_ID=MMETSP1423-20130617/5905_1 /TAXON_ID=476441 /ORGANISM="Pseudo-nitzschia heimii, Strain UNC1101" /LENGTH=657 /DNA_ID=CAMNT_0042631997 /DNA_START=90 /DNA_END=2063 /DNA_ORIENTATION=+
MSASEAIAKILPAKPSIALDQYKALHKQSIENPKEFWGNAAREHLDWFRPFDEVVDGGFEHGDARWFEGGKLNLCYNALDRHVNSPSANEIALICEGDEPTDVKRFTYAEVLRKVCQISNAMKHLGVKKGDIVTIYMPMMPEIVMTMLACTRIGAVHSVVFAGFSAEALGQRISAAKSQYVVTADIGKRGGKTIPLKNIVNDALTKADCGSIVKHVMVFERFFSGDLEAPASFECKEKDIRMDPLVAVQRPYCPPEHMDAEDNLFILYTSGSTGNPKGLVHTTGGYALFAKMTTQITFDLAKDDIFACVADCGWITGHTYIAYGPLLNGSTTFMFESVPTYPDVGRYWDLIQRHKITQFYTAPTAIRAVMRFGDEPVKKYDLSSLRVLGSVGEPINPEAWRWYYEVVGSSKCTVVDTYWQTETGGHIITNLPGVTPMKPGSCTLPFYGIDTAVLCPQTGKELTEPNNGDKFHGVMALKQPWPGMARTCLGDHQRFLNVYYKPYPGYYFTGDTVSRDADGYHFIIGRMDDVINVSGHRIGTAEVESALVAHPAVAQAAVVGKPHDVKGQCIFAFVMLTVGYEESDELIKELRGSVRSEIGAFCTPEKIVVSPSLPMTRSGKIMRRILRKIVCGEADQLGDTSTLKDPSIVDTLIAAVG